MIYRTTAPSATLVTLSELKAHLAIEHSNDDTRLSLLLANARDLIEADANLAITSQVWTQTQDCFTCPLIIEKAPVSSIVVKYYDASNVEQTLSSSNYYVIRNGQEARLIPVTSWPSVYDRPNAVNVEITCGLSSVPGTAKQACLMLCASWNENREAETQGSTSEIRIGYERLINTLRVGRIC